MFSPLPLSLERAKEWLGVRVGFSNMKLHSLTSIGLIVMALLLALCLASCSLLSSNGGETAETGSEDATEATAEVTTEKVKKPISIKDQSTSTYQPETAAPAPTEPSTPTDTEAPKDTTAPTVTTEPYVPAPGVGERLPWEEGTKQ